LRQFEEPPAHYQRVTNPALCSRSCQTGSGSLQREVALKLRDRAQNVEYQLGGPAQVVETAEFVEAEKPKTSPIMDLLHRHPLPVLLGLGISIIPNSSFYLLAYIPTYGVNTLHLPASTVFTATLIGGLILPSGGSNWPRRATAASYHRSYPSSS
jgi:hypothetical protein